MTFIKSITLLLIFQLIGETLTQIFQMPIPGPVLGMMLLLLTLIITKKSFKNFFTKSYPAFKQTTDTLISHLSLFYIPAGVGLIMHFDRIADEWIPLLSALVFGSIISIFFTAIILKLLQKFIKRNRSSQ